MNKRADKNKDPEETPQEAGKIESLGPHEKELIEELETTKKQLEEAKKNLEKENERCLRIGAEFDNFRKRTLKEKEEFVKYANEKLILELIDILENLERGVENARMADNGDKLIEGVELIYNQFKNVLEKNGLTPIKALGEKFDPYKHEAMMITQTDECEEDTVLEELAKGYMLNNKVIRYSKVRVSKRKEDKVVEVK